MYKVRDTISCPKRKIKEPDLGISQNWMWDRLCAPEDKKKSQGTTYIAQKNKIIKKERPGYFSCNAEKKIPVKTKAIQPGRGPRKRRKRVVASSWHFL